MHPELVLRPADPDADRAFLERLALWAVRFTPIVAVDPPDGLVLDRDGLNRALWWRSGLLCEVSDSLQRGGIAAQAVIAGIAEAAAASGARRASRPACRGRR